MSNASILILQYGLGLVFIITSILILKSGDKWTHMLPHWMQQSFSSKSLRYFMIFTAIYDILQGIWLLSGFLLGWAGLAAFLHLSGVLLASNRETIHETYRDLGLLAASLALAAQFLL